MDCQCFQGGNPPGTPQGRGFEKFLMEGAYSRCQLFATEVHYFNIFEIFFDSGNEKIAKENQVVREV